MEKETDTNIEPGVNDLIWTNQELSRANLI
jgi:hypothetical protein